MDDYIEWNDRLIRREAIDYVAAYSSVGILIAFSSEKERTFTFGNSGERDRYLSELMQKVAGTWLEDDKPPQDGTETGPGAFVIQSWGKITAGNS